jgi:hypothetical protein
VQARLEQALSVDLNMETKEKKDDLNALVGK